MRKQVGPLGFRQGRELVGKLGDGIDPNGVTIQSAQAWIDSSTTQTVVAEMLPLGPDETLRRLRREPAAPPSDPELLFEIQAERLRDLKVYKEAGMDEDKFAGALYTVAHGFRYRPDLAAIGLNELLLVPYGIRPEFWIEVGGLTGLQGLNLNHYLYNYRYMKTPERGTIVAIQCQYGEKYRGKNPGWVRDHLNPLEQGMVLEERLVAHAVSGLVLLGRIASDMVGSEYLPGYVPYLSWGIGREASVGMKVSYCAGNSSHGGATRGK